MTAKANPDLLRRHVCRRPELLVQRGREAIEVRDVECPAQRYVPGYRD